MSQLATYMVRTNMRQRPMFAFAILLLAITAVVLVGEVPWQTRPVLTGLLAIVVAAGLVRGSSSAVQLGAAGLMAMITVDRIDWVPPTLQATDRGRVEGVVVAHRITSYGSWLAVAGTLDLRSAEACRCTTIVRSRARITTPLEGAHIVAFGLASRPGHDRFALIERSWARSRAASFFLATDSVHLLRPPPTWTIWRTSVREHLRTTLSAICQPSTAATMYAMITGDRTAVDADLLQAASITGTAHLMAVSGLHVGVLITVLVAFLGGTLHRMWHVVVLSGVVAAYIVVTGGEPPAVRAGIMATLAAVARLREQSADPLNLLGTAMVVEILIWPDVVIRPSFQLSMAVTAALLWLAKPFSDALLGILLERRPWQRALCGAVGLHLAASVGSALPTAILFDQVSLIAPVVNLVVVPVMSAAFVASIAAIIGAEIWHPLGWMLAVPVDLLHHVGVAAITHAAMLAPPVPPTSVALVATSITLAPFWWLRARHGKGLATRLGLTLVLVPLAMLLLRRETNGVVASVVRHQVVVEARAGEQVRRFRLGWTYGCVTVTPID